MSTEQIPDPECPEDENGDPVFGWEAGRAACRTCGYAYVAVFNASISSPSRLECPRCGQFTVGATAEHGAP